VAITHAAMSIEVVTRNVSQMPEKPRNALLLALLFVCLFHRVVVF